MKGQFMIITSVIVGLILLTAASEVAQIKSQGPDLRDTEYHINTVVQEAEKLESPSDKEVRNFRRIVSKIPGHSSRTSYWSSQNCFNVTLTSNTGVYRLNCIG